MTIDVSSADDRLCRALELLRYDDAESRLVQQDLIVAITIFAGASGQKSLEEAGEREVLRLRKMIREQGNLRDFEKV